MLIPISKQLENDSGAVSINFYNLKTKEVSNWTFIEIRSGVRAGIDFRGLTGLDSRNLYNLRLNSFFLNIGFVGVKEDNRQYYTAVKRITYINAIKFVIVDRVGKEEFEIEKSDLIRFMKNGAEIAGVKLTKSGLRISRNDIKIEVVK